MQLEKDVFYTHLLEQIIQRFCPATLAEGCFTVQELGGLTA